MIISICFSFFFILANAQPNTGFKAPEISLKNMEGNTVSLSSLKGKVVLIDFWASWCGPCRTANKNLKKLYNKYKDKGFEIYGISVDYNTKAWKKAIKADKINWIQVYDEGGLIADKWRVSYLPTGFLLNKQGNIIAKDLDGKELEDKLIELL